MKTIKWILSLTLVAALMFATTMCNDEEDPVTLYSISGSVTYPDFAGNTANAGGAVVYLGESEGSTAFIASAVTAANGSYSFTDLQPNSTYYVWATFDTKNTNLPEGRVDRAIFTGAQQMVTLESDQTVDFALSNMGQDDAVAVNTFDGGDWRKDISHSNVDFEFPYDGENALYTGRLTEFDILIDFDPADLSNSSIEASVDMLSVNTSSPGGRDPLYTTDDQGNVVLWQDVEGNYDLGCISGTFSITAPTDDTRTATFTSTDISEYGDGYLATGTLDFAGQTGTVNLFFKYFAGFEAPNRGGTLTQFSSFEGFFEFAAKADFGIESSHVVDEDVTVRVSYQVTKALE